MLITRVPSQYGRLVAKPSSAKNEEEIVDEAPQSIQDQIENLRTKIFLKERYNMVLAYEISENREGAVSKLSDLHNETAELRRRLMHALNSEKFAVQHALRTHVNYQMAMRDRTSYVAIPWLEDVIFDLTKRFNQLLNYLIEKRKKLEEAESMIRIIERWPRPGSLPWEIDAFVEAQRIENKIEDMKVKVETAGILYSKYNEIRYILREEGGKYRPTLDILEEQFRTQQTELSDLKKMLKEANIFKEEAEKNLLQTEKEASENRRERRRQMTRVKKAVDKMLLDNQRSPTKPSPSRPNTQIYNSLDAGDGPLLVTESILKIKRAKIDDLEAKVKKLVEAMRVHNISEIPGRLNTVKELSNHLNTQLNSQARLKELLLLQKGQLFLIQCQLKYTGHKKEEEFLNTLENLKKMNESISKEAENLNQSAGIRGDTTVQIRLGIIACNNQISAGKNLNVHHQSDIKAQMKFLFSKMKHLQQYVKTLKTQFPDEKEWSKKNYNFYTKASSIPDRYIRVGSPVASDNEESEDDEIIDSKIPGRQDIKFRGKRVIQQAIIRRGLK